MKKHILKNRNQKTIQLFAEKEGFSVLKSNYQIFSGLAAILRKHFESLKKENILALYQQGLSGQALSYPL